MFKDITLGQYYQTDSLLHRLDPRIKLTGTLTVQCPLQLYHPGHAGDPVYPVHYHGL